VKLKTTSHSPNKGITSHSLAIKNINIYEKTNKVNKVTKKLTQVCSLYPCEKTLMEEVLLNRAKNLFR